MTFDVVSIDILWWTLCQKNFLSILHGMGSLGGCFCRCQMARLPIHDSSNCWCHCQPGSSKHFHVSVTQSEQHFGSTGSSSYQPSFCQKHLAITDMLQNHVQLSQKSRHHQVSFFFSRKVSSTLKLRILCETANRMTIIRWFTVTNKNLFIFRSWIVNYLCCGL